MVYKLIENENGEYKAADGLRYDLLEAINVMTPQGKNVGWTEYKDLEEAISAFNLVYVGENEEEEVPLEDIIAIMLSEEVNK